MAAHQALVTSLHEAESSGLLYLFGVVHEPQRALLILELVYGVDLEVHLEGRASGRSPPPSDRPLHIPSTSAHALHSSPPPTAPVPYGHLRLSEVEAAGIFSRAIEATAFMHSRGVSHGDIKPENLLLVGIDANGGGGAPRAVKLIDYGSAAMMKCNQAGEVVDLVVEDQGGTEAFQAPERLDLYGDEEDGWFDGVASDTYSLGATLYNTLCGCVPFDFEELGGFDPAFEALRSGAIPFPVPLSPEAVDLVGSLMRWEPTERPSLATVREHCWFAAAVKRATIHPALVVTATPVAESDAPNGTQVLPATFIRSGPPPSSQPNEQGSSGEPDSGLSVASLHESLPVLPLAR